MVLLNTDKTDLDTFWEEFPNKLPKYPDYKQVYIDESKDSNRVECSAILKKEKKELPIK